MQSDLLVLGAGPAGIAVSLLMARRGYSVKVVDPARFPRKKICGEFLNPQATSWLQQQGLFDSLLALNPYPVYGMKIHDGTGRSFTGHYYPRGEGRGFAIGRQAFDELLIKEAARCGVDINEGHQAQRLLFDGDRVIGAAGVDSGKKPFSVYARMVIGADGRNNLIGRTFGWMRGFRNLRKYAFMAYFYDLPGLDHYGEVHLVRNGYVGIAPLTDRLANVALVVDESDYPSGDIASFFLSRIAESPLADRFSGRAPATPFLSAGPLAFRMTRTSGFNTLLVGDACGFIDPFTGEGLNYAFLSAALAEPVIHEALHSNRVEDDALAAYDRAREAMFGQKFRMSRYLQKAIRRPSISNYLIRRFAERMELGDTVVSAVGSILPVQRVWSLRFLWKLVFS